jgi:fermentation-respiration switch protein FrsA (DUF1100 family)
MHDTARSQSALERRRLAGRLVVAALALVALAYGGAAVWLMTQETRLVFEAQNRLGPARPAAPWEQVEIPRDDGARQFAWVMRRAGGDSGAWAIFLHGNSATIASRVNIVRYEQLRSLGVNVLAPEYRGFGGLDGVPSEAGLYADARAAFDYLRGRLGVPPERIAIYGWSLGGAVAIDLASTVAPAALVLEGAPASVVAIGERRYPFFPVRLMIRNPFEAVLRIGAVRAPILFLHSPEDVIVPIEEGRRLHAAATSAARTFVEVRGGHVDAAEVDPAAFLGAIGRLFAAAGLR